MEITNLLAIKSRSELCKWLLQDHKTETECWVAVKRGRPKNDGTFWYVDAVEEALCFRVDRQYRQKDSRRYYGAETVPPQGEKQLVGTEQGAVPQNGTARPDDGCRTGRIARHVGRRIRNRPGYFVGVAV